MSFKEGDCVICKRGSYKDQKGQIVGYDYLEERYMVCFGVEIKKYKASSLEASSSNYKIILSLGDRVRPVNNHYSIFGLGEIVRVNRYQYYYSYNVRFNNGRTVNMLRSELSLIGSINLDVLDLI